MMDAGDHASERRRVLHFDDLLHAAEAEAADRLAHTLRAADEADNPLDFHGAAGLLGGGFLFGGHFAWREALDGGGFFRSLAAAFGNLGRVFQMHERIEPGL